LETQSFVLRFVRSVAGGLRCRVTDVASRAMWAAKQPDELRRLVHERHAETNPESLKVREDAQEMQK
jgi:hypothetical protein